MTFEIPITITLIFIWALLTALGLDRNFKTLSDNDSNDTKLKWEQKNADTISKYSKGFSKLNDKDDCDEMATIKEKSEDSLHNSFQASTPSEQPILKNTGNSKSILDDMMPNWLQKKKLSNFTEEKSSNQRRNHHRSEDPVVYNVKHTKALYCKLDRFALRQRPTEKYTKRYSYNSKNDVLQNDWERYIGRFSECNQAKNNFFSNGRSCRYLLYRKTEKIVIKKNFLCRPNERCIYKIKKDIRAGAFIAGMK